MRKIFLFVMVSLDGFFEGLNHELDWHNVDREFNDFAIAQLKEVDLLLFGRITYDLMANFWPTEAAKKDDPVVSRLMNDTPKIVFSRTLRGANWENTRLVKENAIEEVNRLKIQKGKDIAIFGSSDLAVSFLEAGILDELRIMVNPVVIGQGKILFQGIKNKLNHKL
jgi:dihydrofolate reductase